ncbi:hypothetical protein MY4038_000427 [Beauveria bassiana]
MKFAAVIVTSLVGYALAAPVNVDSNASAPTNTPSAPTSTPSAPTNTPPAPTSTPPEVICFEAGEKVFSICLKTPKHDEDPLNLRERCYTESVKARKACREPDRKVQKAKEKKKAECTVQVNRVFSQCKKDKVLNKLKADCEVTRENALEECKNKGLKPDQQETTPSKEEATPGTEEATPGTEEATPGTEEATPGTEEATPDKEEAAESCPSEPEEEATSAKEEAAPIKEEATPVKEEAAPVKEEAAPVKEEAAPVKEEAAPVKEEAAPVKEEATPGTDEVPQSCPSKPEPESESQIDSTGQTIDEYCQIMEATSNARYNKQFCLDAFKSCGDPTSLTDAKAKDCANQRMTNKFLEPLDS